MLNKYAETKSHYNVDPPRQHATPCGDNHIAAAGLKQSNFNQKRDFDKKPGASMSKIAPLPALQASCVSQSHFNPKQIEILKNSICKGVSNEEFEVFIMACMKTQLDPFMRQIYAVKRKSKKPDGSWGETMTIQTGIDGYRLIAERTEKYAPGPEPTYSYKDNGELLSATSYIKKQTRDGTWHIVSASAFIDEYLQTTLDRQTGEKKASGMWGNMPRTMLAKCAEAQALRKAFPAEMSGVYTKEEMQQADIDVTPKITLEQAAELDMVLSECEDKYRIWFYDYVRKLYNTDNISDLPSEIYQRMKDAAVKNMETNHARQQAETKSPDLIAQEIQ